MNEIVASLCLMSSSLLMASPTHRVSVMGQVDCRGSQNENEAMAYYSNMRYLQYIHLFGTRFALLEL